MHQDHGSLNPSIQGAIAPTLPDYAIKFLRDAEAITFRQLTRPDQRKATSADFRLNGGSQKFNRGLFDVSAKLPPEQHAELMYATSAVVGRAAERAKAFNAHRHAVVARKAASPRPAPRIRATHQHARQRRTLRAAAVAGGGDSGDDDGGDGEPPTRGGVVHEHSDVNHLVRSTGRACVRAEGGAA
jgi:hypothetical protein